MQMPARLAGESTLCTSTRCSHEVVMAKTVGASHASSARRMTIRSHPTIVSSLHGPRWSTTARQPQQQRPTISWTGTNRDA